MCNKNKFLAISLHRNYRLVSCPLNAQNKAFDVSELVDYSAKLTFPLFFNKSFFEIYKFVKCSIIFINAPNTKQPIRFRNFQSRKKSIFFLDSG